MATSTEELAGYLEEAGVRHRINDDGDILTAFKTRQYKDRDGDNAVPIIIHLEEDGEYLKVFTPVAYSCKDSPHLGLVLQATLVTSWFTKMVQFEYDQNDGEIRAIIEFPIEDSGVTKKQLLRCVKGLAQILDTYDSMIRGAIERGVIELPAEHQQAREVHEMLAAAGGDRESVMREFAEFLAARRQRSGLDLED